MLKLSEVGPMLKLSEVGNVRNENLELEICADFL